MKKTLNLIGITLLFSFLTSIFLYPLILRIHSYIPGFSSTDEPFGILWRFWWWAYAHSHGLSASTTNFIIYPFGATFDITFTNPLSYTVTKWLTIFFGEIADYNIEIILSFILSGIFMYLLVKHLSKK